MQVCNLTGGIKLENQEKWQSWQIKALYNMLAAGERRCDIAVDIGKSVESIRAYLKRQEKTGQ